MREAGYSCLRLLDIVSRQHIAGPPSGGPFFDAGSMLQSNMALIYSHGTKTTSDMIVACWVCGGTLSRQAKECPHCGQPEPAEESIRRFEERHQQQLDAAIARSKHGREEMRFYGLVMLICVGIWFCIWLFIFP